MKESLPDPWEIIQRGWRSTIPQFGTLLGAWAVFFAILIGISGVTTVGIQLAFFRDRVLVQVVSNSVNGLLGIGFLWLYAGLLKIHLAVARGERAVFSDLFGQGRLLGSYLLTNSLVQVVVFLLYVPVAVIAGPPTGYLLSQGAIGPALIVGGAFLIVAVILILPVVVATLNALFFVIDREHDPVAAIVAGFHSIRGQSWWCVRFGLWGAALYLAFIVFAVVTCGLGLVTILFLAPFGLLVSCHLYLALSEELEATIKGPAPVKEEPPSDDAYAPPSDVPVYQRPSARYEPPSGPEFGSEAAPRRVELVVPGGADFFPPRSISSAAVPIAILLFVPWFAAGGSPIGMGVAGWWIARRLGFPQWIGITSGVGALMLCGVAALVLLMLAFRGRRAAVMDTQGFCLDVTPHWQGIRVRWFDLAGFRITGQGVRLYLRNRWLRWIWSPVLPCSDRQAHDVVSTLESHKVFRVE